MLIRQASANGTTPGKSIALLVKSNLGDLGLKVASPQKRSGLAAQPCSDSDGRSAVQIGL
jgi:hypothetical protein